MKSFLPIRWADAYGATVWDQNMKEYIDFTSGIFVANVGHSNSRVREAINDVRFYHCYNYDNVYRDRYIEKLCEWTGFECAALFSAGCEAVEGALRVMKSHGKGGQVQVLHTPGIFQHGKTMGARMHPSFGREIEENSEVQEDRGNLLGVCGIILESYRGWDAHFWDKGWIQYLRAYCTEYNILLCFDEIQSGFGRTGKKFCYEHYDVVPDLVCIGKGMGGGVPLSGLLGSRELLDLPGDLGSTHSANPTACAAGLAVLEEFEDRDLIKESWKNGDLLKSGLKDISEKHNILVNGCGMVAALMFGSVEIADKFVMDCYEKGLLVVHTGRESVKLGPPLTITEKEMSRGLNIIREVL